MNRTCPTCTSPEIEHQGTLGWREHFRCVSCGQGFSVEVQPKDKKQKARWLRQERKAKAQYQRWQD